MQYRKFFKSVVLTIALLLSNSAYAEINTPTNVDPGVVTDFQPQTDKRDHIKKFLDEQKQKEEEKEDYDLDKDDNIRGNVQQNTFVLNKVEYSGNDLFPAEDLDEINSEYIGERVDLEKIKRIMRNITAYYNNKGYISSYAYLPAQVIRGGVVKVNIVESKVTNIAIKGNEYSKTSYLKNNIFKRSGIKQDELFNVKDLRKSLGLINEKEYMKGRVILEKGEEPDQLEVTLEVDEKLPLEFEAGWDNRGRTLIGQQRASLKLEHQNLSGYGDSLGSTVFLGRRSFGISNEYSLPVGPYGTEFKVRYGYSDVNVGGVYKALGLQGSAHVLSTGIVQPIYEGDTLRVESDLFFDVLSSKTTDNLDGTRFSSVDGLVSKYNLRVLRAGINAIKDDMKGRWISRMEVSTGLDLMGASKNLLDSEGNPRFVKLSPSLVRVHYLPWKMTGLVRFSGQYSPQHLLPAEQYQMGGMYAVRGYQEGLLFGDYGYLASFELRRPIPGLPDFKYLKLKDKVSLATFVDHGFSNDIGQSESSENFLQSVGFGFRVFLNKFMTASFDLGFPIGNNVTANDDGVRFHFSINSDLI